MKHKQLRFLAIGFVLLLAVASVAMLRGLPSTNPAVTPRLEQTQTQLSTSTPPPVTVRLMAVGDNLIHDSVYMQARSRANGSGYDFRYAYDGVRELLAQAGLSVINQESIVAGALRRPSTYPMFNSPTELGDEVYALGFRAINLSNNHMLDQGTAGAVASLDYWASKEGLVTSGAYRDENDFNTPHMLTINGISFAFCSATFSFNGLQLPGGSELILPLLEEEDRLQQAITLANESADVVVVSLHWGMENSQETTQAQRDLARKCVDWGADLILGTHPHVLQGMEWLDKPGGGQAFVTWSLGNFISAQSRAPQLIGGILAMNVTKEYLTGAITLSSPKFLPTITHYSAGYANLHLIPWSEYTPALASAHGVRRSDSRFTYDYCKTLLKNTIPEEFLVME